MENEYILVIDSGVGGTSILKNLIKRLPNKSFIYFADNKNSPYGNKSKKFLTKNIENILNEMLKTYKIELVVFACNTITATSIQKMRKIFKNLKFVGTEPPVKLVNKNEKTLILSTEQTLKNCKLLTFYKSKSNFTFIPLKDVASMLDNNFFNRKDIIKSLKTQVIKNDYKSVVLGCTHYYFLENEINEVLNNNDLKFYKSVTGVTNRVKSLVKENNESLQNIKVILSKPDKVLENTINFILTYY